MELSGPPPCYEVEYQTLLTSEALMFVAELVRQFDKNVEQVIYSIIIIGCYLYSYFVLCFVSLETVFYVSICTSDHNLHGQFCF